MENSTHIKLKDILLFRKIPYNLPAKFPVKTGLILGLIMLAADDYPGLPLGSIVGIIVIIHFFHFSRGENELGLRWRLTTRTRWTIVVIVSFVLCTFIFFAAAMDYYKTFIDLEPDAAEFFAEQQKISLIAEEWNPPPALYSALENKDIGATIDHLTGTFFVALISAPIWESVSVFGLIFPVLYRRFGYRKSILAAALIFVLMHSHYFGAPDTVILLYISALIDGALYVYTRSLYPAIIAHAGHNFLSVAIQAAFNWGLPPPTG